MAGRRRRPPWQKPKPAPRVVGFELQLGPGQAFDEERVATILNAGRRAGIVRRFGLEGGDTLWCEGRPCRALRALESKVQGAVAALEEAAE